MTKVIKFFPLIITLLLLNGCISSSDLPLMSKLGPSHQTQPAINTYYKTMPPAEGSLWSDSGNMLFTDKKARQVGDTVIIDIVENSSSNLNAGTTTSRATGIDAGISSFLGYMKQLEEANPGMDREKLISASYGSTFGGKGTSDRSGSITGSIAARVTAKLPNGNISVYGKRELKINSETQYMIISGIVRPEDIDSSNRVKSNYLANASIEYSGHGAIADKQKVGWLSRILSNIWPF